MINIDAAKEISIIIFQDGKEISIIIFQDQEQ